MPRRLAVARHAGGFDAVGWTLLGFLLGASLAVFALLHADFHGLMRPLAVPAAAPAPARAVITYAPPAPPLAGPAPTFVTPDAAPAGPPPVVRAPVRVLSALASAGVASTHASGEAHARPAAPPARAAQVDAQVDDDAAAAGLTSRAAATPKSPAASPDLY